MEILICSSSGKPIFYHRLRQRAVEALAQQPVTLSDASEEENDSDSASCALASSLQGLLAYVSCIQHEELQEIQAATGLRCLFLVKEPLTFTVILRQQPSESQSHSQEVAQDLVAARCLRRLLSLLHAHISLVLSDRGVDVLRKQPGYDLRDLLHGTEASMRSLVHGWSQEPTLRLEDFGVRFLRMPFAQRKEIQKIIETSTQEPPNGSPHDGMICGLLLAKQQVVALSQPNPKQFSILTDDLHLLVNFVYFTKALRKSETWTPVCLPNFNANGFLYAYVVFITPNICLVLLSADQKPEQFHRFQDKKERILGDFEQLQILRRIHQALDESVKWRPHQKLSTCIRHFVCKFEQANECCFPAFFIEELEEDSESSQEQRHMIQDVLNKYANLYHLMLPHLSATKPAIPIKSWGSFGSLESRSASSTTSSIGSSSSTAVPPFDGPPSARMLYVRSESELIIGVCTDDTRFFVCLEPFLSLPEGNELAHRLMQVLRKEQEAFARMNMRP